MFSNLFQGIDHIKDQKYLEVFKRLKPFLIERIHIVLDSRRLSHSGRPKFKFLDALFFVVESGTQIRYVKETYGFPTEYSTAT